MGWNRRKTGAIFSLFLLIGCSVEPNAPPPPVTSITISPQQGNVALGATLKMSALGVTSAGAIGEAVPVASWQSDDTSVATIDSNGIVSPIGLGVTTITASSGTFRGMTTIGIVSSGLGSEDLNITGHAFYEDKLYNENGFTGQLANNPIRQAVVELIAIDGFATLASGTTTEEGRYQFSGIKNNSRRGGVYLRLHAKTAESSFNPITIQDNDKDKNIWFVYGRPLDDSVNGAFPSDQIKAFASGIGGAFNILDSFIKGGEFIQKMDTCVPQNGNCKPALPPTLLTGYWEQGVQSSTSYEGTSNAIFINGGFMQPGATVGDTDEYDDTILLHEYGHFVSTRLAHDDSPGGQHILLDNKQDIRLAWSEGWASFFAGVVLQNPLIVDTKDNKASSKLNIETISSMSSSPLYTTNEAAVAAILWDLFDAAPNDDDPAINIGFDKVWKGFAGMASPATMESFFISFINQSPESADPFQGILQRAKIEFFPDTGETAGETPLLFGISQHHTLYRSDNPFSDEDVIPFVINANQTYSIRTRNLTNGADTFLTIQDAGGSILLQNDNANGKTYAVQCDPCPMNDPTTLSSLISLKSTITQQLSVRVKRSPNAPNSTGLTGSYDILLASP